MKAEVIEERVNSLAPSKEITQEFIDEIIEETMQDEGIDDFQEVEEVEEIEEIEEIEESE